MYLWQIDGGGNGAEWEGNVKEFQLFVSVLDVSAGAGWRQATGGNGSFGA